MAEIVVEGSRVRVSSDVVSMLSTVQQYVGDDSGDDASDLAFELPNWFTSSTWEKIVAYANILLGQGDSTQQLNYLEQNLGSLDSIVQAADFLGFGALTELAGAALVLQMRKRCKDDITAFLTASAEHADPASSSPNLAQTQRQPSKRWTAWLSSLTGLFQSTTLDDSKPDLHLLFPASSPDTPTPGSEAVPPKPEVLDGVLPVKQPDFWPLVDRLAGSGAIPPSAILPALLRARIWPVMSVKKNDSITVNGVWGGGDKNEYLKLHLPVSLLREFDVHAVRGRVRSHDQGWCDSSENRGTYNGSWTFGTLELLDIPDLSVKKHETRLYTNLTATSEWQPHEKVFDHSTDTVKAVNDAAALVVTAAAASATASNADAATTTTTAISSDKAPDAQGTSAVNTTAFEKSGADNKTAVEHALHSTNTESKAQKNASSTEGCVDACSRKGGAGVVEEGEPGLDLAVVVQAFFPGWSNHVSNAELECFLWPKHVPAL